ncbi:MAG: TIGR00730 family Rossman fold protein [Pseudomonadota bacterium]
MGDLTSLCVYCGSSAGDDPKYLDAAVELGRACAAQNVRLVYGGGRLGLMGASAGAARDAGGRVYGVIPDFLVEREGILENVDHDIVETMHERKLKMFEAADAFCILPGGIGTLEELVEILSWARLDLHRKSIVIVDLDGYWSPFVALIEHMVGAKFAHPDLLRDFCVVESAADVIPTARDRMLRARV